MYEQLKEEILGLHVSRRLSHRTDARSPFGMLLSQQPHLFHIVHSHERECACHVASASPEAPPVPLHREETPFVQ